MASHNTLRRRFEKAYVQHTEAREAHEATCLCRGCVLDRATWNAFGWTDDTGKPKGPGSGHNWGPTWCCPADDYTTTLGQRRNRARDREEKVWQAWLAADPTAVRVVRGHRR